MKIDRLIGILAVLLQQEKVTAPYLAEKFEVSRRTINRDIEDLCQAGIPVVTMQGVNGGISIMDGYKMDKTLLTSSDMQAILAGLRSLDSVSGSSRYQQLMEKLSMGNSTVLASNSHIMIDLSSWHKSSLAPKIELIQSAIERNDMISFYYYAPKGESRRTIEPYLLVFQWASWYIWGYCIQREGYRMFKLNRLQELKITGEKFSSRELPEFQQSMKQSIDNIYPPQIYVTALFEAEMKWRVVEEYGIDSFTQREDGKLLFRYGFGDKAGLFSWLLSFGAQVEVLEPIDIRNEMKEVVQAISKRYS